MASQIQDDARRTNIIFPELASGYFQYLYSSDYFLHIKFIDKETGEEITTDPSHIKKEYVSHFKRHCDMLKDGCGHNRIEYVQLLSNQSLDSALAELLLKRKNY